jgi:hypothetical protein
VAKLEQAAVNVKSTQASPAGFGLQALAPLLGDLALVATEHAFVYVTLAQAESLQVLALKSNWQ